MKTGKSMVAVLIALISVFALGVVACDKEPKVQSGPEVGVYYYDAAAGECTLELKEECKFTLTPAGGGLVEGDYKLADGVLTLTPSAEGAAAITAKYEDETIVLTYEGIGENVRFLRKTEFTVTFDTKEGTAVDAVTVVNGRKLAESAIGTTTREGYVFAGWFTDAECTQAYSFDTPVTGNMVLYAGWAQETATVTFVVPDEYGKPVASQTVILGAEYQLPVPEFADVEDVDILYAFTGWYDESDNRVADQNGKSLSVFDLCGDGETVELTAKYAPVFTFDGEGGVSAGEGMPYVTEITVPEYDDQDNQIITIGDGAFKLMTNLVAANIPNSVNSFNAGAFTACPNLSVLNFYAAAEVQEPTFKTIDNVLIRNEGNAIEFYPYNAKSAVDLSETEITSVGTAFQSTAVTSITLPTTVTEIDDEAFYYCAFLTEINLPSTITSLGDAFENCVSLEAINITGNDTYTSQNGVLFTEEGATLYYVPEGFKGDNGVYNVPVAVSTIADYAFYNNKGLNTVNLPPNVNSVGSAAFAYSSIATVTGFPTVSEIPESCFKGSAIENFAVPAGVTSIADNAFQGCSDLTSITIPASVTSIGGYAFQQCKKLTAVTFAPSSMLSEIGDYAFQNSGLTSFNCPQSVTSIGSNAFAYCRALETFTFDGVPTINSLGGSAFSYSGLTSIVIPASITSFGTWDNYFFYNCTSLSSVTFAAGSQITSIPSYMFGNCAIASIEVPASVTDIGDNAFNGCASLTSVVLANDSALQTIGSGAFNGTQINGFDFSKTQSLTSIGDSAFEGTAITGAVVIPECVTSIGNSAFAGTSITGLTLPGTNLATIGNSAFEGTALTGTITLPDSVTSVGSRAFADLAGLKVNNTQTTKLMSIGAEAFLNADTDAFYFVTNEQDHPALSIGDCAFAGTKLTTVSIPEATPNSEEENLKGSRANNDKISIGANAFAFSTIATATLPDSITEYKGYFAGCPLTSLTMSGCAELTVDSAANIVKGAKTASDLYGAVPNAGTYTIPSGFTVVKPYAFANAKGITKLIIPAEVTAIEDYAFYGSSIGEIEFATRTADISIGKNAFANTALSGAVTLANVSSIGDGAFNGCTAITSVSISGSFASIGALFSGCTSLTSITINSTAELLTVGSQALSGLETLASVSITGTAVKLEDTALHGSSAGVVIDSLTVNNLKTVGLNPFGYSKQINITPAADAEFVQEDGIVYNAAKNRVLAITAAIDEFTVTSSVQIGNSSFTPMTCAFDSYFAVNYLIIDASLFAFYNANIVGTVEFKVSVTSIPANSFQNTRGAFDVIFEDSDVVTEFKANAFNGSTGLRSIVIGKNVVTFKSNVFNNCVNLETVTFVEGGTQELIFDQNNIFNNCTSLTRIVLPERLTRLTYNQGYSSKGGSIFAGCTALEEVILPSTLTDIGNYAFNGCTSIKRIVIPKGVVAIGSGAFQGWTEEQTIVFEGTPGFRFEVDTENATVEFDSED